MDITPLRPLPSSTPPSNIVPDPAGEALYTQTQNVSNAMAGVMGDLAERQTPTEANWRVFYTAITTALQTISKLSYPNAAEIQIGTLALSSFQDILPTYASFANKYGGGAIGELLTDYAHISGLADATETIHGNYQGSGNIFNYIDQFNVCYLLDGINDLSATIHGILNYNKDENPSYSLERPIETLRTMTAQMETLVQTYPAISPDEYTGSPIVNLRYDVDDAENDQRDPPSITLSLYNDMQIQSLSMLENAGFITHWNQ